MVPSELGSVSYGGVSHVESPTVVETVRKMTLDSIGSHKACGKPYKIHVFVSTSGIQVVAKWIFDSKYYIQVDKSTTRFGTTYAKQCSVFLTRTFFANIISFSNFQCTSVGL